MPGRVGLQGGVRRRAAAAALVEQHDVVARGVELPTVRWRNAAAGPAVQEDGGLRAPGADPLPVDDVAVADIEPAGLEGLDLRVERAQRAHCRGLPGNACRRRDGLPAARSD